MVAGKYKLKFSLLKLHHRLSILKLNPKVKICLCNPHYDGISAIIFCKHFTILLFWNKTIVLRFVAK